MRDYGKLLWSIVGAVAFFLQAALQDGMDKSEWVGVAIAGVGAVVVWLAQDTTIADYVKSWAGGIMAGLLVLQTAITQGLTAQSWIAIVIAVLTGAGIIIDQRRPVHAVSTVAPTRPTEAY